eukprot:10012788-Ditylum_brightwellii.AAC.1
MKWWIDGSFVVCANMKSHTGAIMSLGKGSIYSALIKQKIDTRNSTEIELVTVNGLIPIVLWTYYFLKDQGNEVNKSMICQGNKRSILLEKNGKVSSSKQTWHINIRHFFAKNRVEKGEVDIEYCPTEEMIGDFFSKTLQVKKFKVFIRKIMNLEDECSTKIVYWESKM